jgi:hypothetical protein
MLTVTITYASICMHTQYVGAGVVNNTHGGVPNLYTIFVGKSEGKRPLADLGIDGRIILKCILKTQDVTMCI